MHALRYLENCGWFTYTSDVSYGVVEATLCCKSNLIQIILITVAKHSIKSHENPTNLLSPLRLCNFTCAVDMDSFYLVVLKPFLRNNHRGFGFSSASVIFRVTRGKSAIRTCRYATRRPGCRLISFQSLPKQADRARLELERELDDLNERLEEQGGATQAQVS